MDFEQALKAGGTVVLEEGRRLESLGVSSSSTPLGESSSGRSSSRPGSSSARQQPATPTVVPPTPESTLQRVSPAEKQRNAAGEKSRLPVQSETPQSTTTTAKAGGPLASSPTIIGGVPFQESSENEVQSKRRSLFRSSGTASSPDLAALMRKGKERGGGGVGGVEQSSDNGSARTTYQQQQQYQDSATQNSSNHLSPPVVIGGGGGSSGAASSQSSSGSNPAASQYQQDQHARQRTRSSTSSSFSVISSPSLSDAPPPPPAAHVKSRGKMAKAEKVLGVTGQGIGSHSAFDNGWSNTERAPKQSIRSKTSALWGKVTGTTRQRGLSSASSTVPNTPITPNSATTNPFTQPSAPPSFSVSPPPAHNPRSPYGARSTTLRDDLFTSPKAASSTNLTKPLPPIYPGSFGEDDGRGTLKAGKGKAKAPTMPPVSGGGRGNRRRSMSVDAMDLKQILAMGGRISSEIDLEKAHPSLPRPDLESNDGHSLLSGWNLSTTGGLDDFRGSFAGLTGPPSSSSDGHSTTKPKPGRPRALTTELPPPELVPPGSARSEQSNSVPSTPYLSTDAIAINTSFGSNVSAATAKPPSEREARYSSDVTAMPSEPEISDLSASESSKPPTRRGSMRSSPGLPPGAAPPRLYGSSLHAPSDTSRPNAMSSSEPSLVPQRSAFTRRGSADVISPQQSTGTSLQVSIDSPPQNRTMRPGTASSRQFRMNSDPGSGLEVSVFEYGGDGAISSPALASEEDLSTRAKAFADRCWREDETFKAREKIAEWLGGSGTLNKQALSYYMDHFDFKGYRLDNAFRHLCGKLYLKAETQQVDRILEQFGRRYWDCNPGNIFGNPSVVHSVAYSLLLLNTDLHIADIASHMSRGQFVRNTLFAITESARSSSPTSAAHPSLNPAARASTPDLPSHSEEVSRRQSGETSDPTTLRMKSKRSGSITSWKSGSREAVGGMLGNASTPALLSSSAVNQPNGASSSDPSKPSTPTARGPPVFSRSWELEMENLLKDMYNAIKERQILQPTSSMERSSMSSLTPGSTLIGRSRSQRRNGSTNALKRGSIRGIQTLLGSQSPYSSNSSSTDGRVSPSPSFATSFGDAVSASSSSLFAPTLGFASNLSHTIIKEAQEDDAHSIDSVDTADTTVSITDEELALQGAPWAKEGMLCRKQYWESTGKRAKDKSWMDVFVVIQKGTLNMFTFGEMTAAASRGGGVGGGNWLANATPMGTVNLAHSLAHVLPPPGYNRSRPHCFVLTLSTDAVYFFQAGTEDLVNEWVSTCNYWAARTSKEPLQGGVSNMEYGWSKVEQNQNNPHANNSVDNSDAYSDVFSVRSGRSKISKRSFDVLGSARSNYSPFAMEKIFINDWKAPIHSTIPSAHDEETQMEALQKQVGILKRELAVHDKIQVPMQNMYQPRSPNFMKAMGNWEAKSKYLLAEVFKYETYVDCLRDAMSLRLKKRGEKVLERALDSGAEGEAFTGLSLRPSRRGLREETIQEAEEPLTPGPTSAFSQHIRETATNS